MKYGSLQLRVGEFKGKMPVDIRQMPLQTLTDDALAEVFAVVANHLGAVMHEVDCDRDVWSAYAFYEWWDVEELLLEEIFRRTIAAGMIREKPETGYHPIIEPFMDAHGYRDGSGWWIEKK